MYKPRPEPVEVGIPRPFHLIEFLEDPELVLSWNSWTLIDHLDLNIADGLS